MAKKIKIVNEDPSINFRLPEPLKKELHKRAALENKTVSNYLRDHLTEFTDGTLLDKEVSHFQKHDFINSTEFLQLIVWMYTKRENKKCTSDNTQLDYYLETIKFISAYLPKDLVVEFDKVLLDVLRVKNEEFDRNKIFIFSKKSNVLTGFNYEKLEQFLLIQAPCNKVVMRVS